MSTDFQKYSIDNQKAEIGRYAAAHGMEIVRTYADEGRSGLSLRGRPGLIALLEDVRRGSPGFEVLLVLDVSRWGRFQDADEAAYYEFRCRRAGVPVIYCGEPFENDGSPYTTIVKSIKRVMAAEYSRELSTKVRIGKARLASLGVYLGPNPGLGQRRLVVSAEGVPKAILKVGERKAVQSDRITLVPGPREEVELVNRIFCLFAFSRMFEIEIARLLNAEGLRNDRGSLWSYQYIHNMLINERLIGTNVYNKRSQILTTSRKNPPEDWIRVEDAFEAIVPKPVFARVQAIMARRRSGRSSEQMLAALKDLLETRGKLSFRIINEAVTLPSAAAYKHMFGSLCKAYAAIGYVLPQDTDFIALKHALRTDVIDGFAARGIKIRSVSRSSFVVDGDWTLNTIVARCKELPRGRVWWTKLKKTRSTTVTVIARPNPDGASIRDYVILPNGLRKSEFTMREDSDVYEDFRHDDLSGLFERGEMVFRQFVQAPRSAWDSAPSPV